MIIDIKKIKKIDDLDEAFAYIEPLCNEIEELNKRIYFLQSAVDSERRWAERFKNQKEELLDKINQLEKRLDEEIQINNSGVERELNLICENNRLKKMME